MCNRRIWDPVGLTKASDPGKPARKQAKKQAELLKQGMAAIDATFAGYGPEFYQERALATERAGLPSLLDKYNQAKGEVGFGLANRGLLRSSGGERLGDRLERQFAASRQNLAERGVSDAQALEREIAGNRNTLVSQLQAAVAPTGQTISFLNQAAAKPAPNPATPIVQGFGDFAKDYLMANLVKTNPYTPTTQTMWGGGGTLGRTSDQSPQDFSTVYPQRE